MRTSWIRSHNNLLLVHAINIWVSVNLAFHILDFRNATSRDKSFIMFYLYQYATIYAYLPFLILQFIFF